MDAGPSRTWRRTGFRQGVLEELFDDRNAATSAPIRAASRTGTAFRTASTRTSVCKCSCLRFDHLFDQVL